jgi:hypothetical protein
MTVRKVITLIELVCVAYFLYAFAALYLARTTNPFSALEALGVIVAVVLLIRYIINRRNQQISRELYDTYYQALVAKDKPAALEAGRDYYGFKRGGELTIADEQAIANDLLAYTQSDATLPSH